MGIVEPGGAMTGSQMLGPGVPDGRGGRGWQGAGGPDGSCWGSVGGMGQEFKMVDRQSLIRG